GDEDQGVGYRRPGGDPHARGWPADGSVRDAGGLRRATPSARPGGLQWCGPRRGHRQAVSAVRELAHQGTVIPSGKMGNFRALALALILVPAVAAAQSAKDKQRASDLVKQAIAKSQGGDHEKAVELYEAAYK